ncbi:hypothetical protein [Daejeonella sp.]|jgi:hypothetical protein|uniref:hypothetical protein n=1 Tax=Daejeonella sp. TaxID=2805397 RepID=UPI0037848394
MKTDHLIIVAILIFIIILLLLLIKWNRKDQKEFIETMNKDIGKPENHPKDKI